MTEGLVGDVLTEVQNGFGYVDARVKIYQSINPSFNPDIEFVKDPICRDSPPVDNSLFAIARKLILESK